MVIVPPPIQGLGLSGGFQMQVELTDGSSNLNRLQAVTEEIIAQARTSPVIRIALTPLRASVPQITIDVNQTQAQSFGVVTGDVYQTGANLSWFELRQSIHQVRS